MIDMSNLKIEIQCPPEPEPWEEVHIYQQKGIRDVIMPRFRRAGVVVHHDETGDPLNLLFGDDFVFLGGKMPTLTQKPNAIDLLQVFEYEGKLYCRSWNDFGEVINV